MIADELNTNHREMAYWKRKRSQYFSQCVIPLYNGSGIYRVFQWFFGNSWKWLYTYATTRLFKRQTGALNTHMFTESWVRFPDPDRNWRVLSLLSPIYTGWACYDTDHASPLRINFAKFNVRILSDTEDREKKTIDYFKLS